ncbi:chaplin family protein [Streptomyces sp. NPDC046261]|uniref:chaplin n=1 Tax=Streptomyces sp. NPDC046261 TaxID=3157200 RepID=UPI0033F538CE
MRQVTKKGLITVAAASGVIAAVTGGYAQADSGANGAATHSPGVASGNTVQVPVHVPVNACGNTVNVVGLLNPATGNRCVNGGHGHKGHGGHGHGGHGGYGHGGALADGKSVGSPGVASGNTAQVPVSIPVNACGNSVNVVGIGNSTHGNTCVNNGHGPAQQGHGHKPPHGEKPGHQGPQKPGGHHNPPTEAKPGHKPPAKHHDEPAGHPGAPGHHQAKPAMEVKDAHLPAAPLAEHRPATVAQKAAELAHTGAGQLGAAGAASAGLLLGGAMLYRRSRGAQG